MEQQRDLAIVLRSVPFEERHRVVTALTEKHGRISAMARNSIQSRRFGGTLDAFAAAEWRFVIKPGADLFHVEGADIRRAFEGIRSDFERLALASVFNELMIRIAPEREPCPELFRIHSNALALLDELPKKDPLPPLLQVRILNAYLAKVLQAGGHQPQIQACASCATPLDAIAQDQSVNALVADAAWICASCRASETHHVQSRQGAGFQSALLRVKSAALHDFHVALVTPMRQIPDKLSASLDDHRGLFKYLEAILTYHIPGFDQAAPLKGVRFLAL